ncbi:unnamed protein product [Calypogeia fissa]
MDAEFPRQRPVAEPVDERSPRRPRVSLDDPDRPDPELPRAAVQPTAELPMQRARPSRADVEEDLKTAIRRYADLLKTEILDMVVLQVREHHFMDRTQLDRIEDSTKRTEMKLTEMDTRIKVMEQKLTSVQSEVTNVQSEVTNVQSRT